MSGDSFQETSYQNWFQRIGNSIGGALVGVVLFLVSFVVLFWNEGRAVDTARSLEEAGGAVVSVPSDKVDPANDGKLVHLSGEAKTDETLSDDVFGNSANAIRLIRHVEMYQWQEKKETKSQNKVGGGQVQTDTYTYTKAWLPTPVDSSRFKEVANHINPPAPWPLESRTITAQKVTVGAFVLSPELVAQIKDREKLPFTDEQFKKLPDDQQKQWQLVDGVLFRSAQPTAPEVGDLRVGFEVVKPTTVSVMAQQQGQSFVAFQPKTATAKIDLLYVGAKSAQEMIAQEQATNRTLTWVLRLVGFVLMGVGIYLVLAPAQMFANVLPFLGGLVGFMLGAFAFVCAGVLSLVTIAISWLWYRPFLGIAILVVAAGGAVGLLWILRRARKSAPQAG